MEPRYRVILVEDSAAIRETLIQSLESSGKLSVVGVAETGADACHLIDDTPADAVIIDLQLRGGTGFEVLAHLKVTPAVKKPVQIVLTNYVAPIFRRRCEEYGADYFFDKSLEFDRVISTLHTLADRAAHPGYS
jgi:DNA-binding NarL/FixJ family response regulator